MTATLRLVLTIALLAVATVLLWLTYGYASAYRLYGSVAMATTFRIATALAAGALFVLVAVRALFRPLYEWIAQQPPTHLQMGVAVTAATFVAVAAALAWFGVDLSTILTTSALVTAIVGLAVQPLLAGLASGLALQRTVRIGDGILLSGRPVAVTALDWRSVVARRSDGAALIIPNSKLAGDTVEVLPRDRPVRASITIDLPADLAPHRVSATVARVAAAIQAVDAARTPIVSPQACRFGGTVAYEAVFWVTRFDDLVAAEVAMLRRCWYAFRREGVASGVEGGAAGPDGVASGLEGVASGPEGVASGREGERDDALPVGAIAGALSSTDVDLSTLGPDFAGRALRDGLYLEYDDGEPIVLPERSRGTLCLVAAGRIEIVERGAAPRSGASAGAPPAASAAAVERALARRIGPYASIAVSDALADAASLVALCRAVAEEIDDPVARAAFLDEVLPPARPIRMPGTVFRAHRNAIGELVAHDPPAVAVVHALVIVVPERSDGGDRPV